jgi:hypothetical protein
MKNLVKTAFASVFVVVIVGYGVYVNQKTNTMSNSTLANVEALASGESGGDDRVCFNKWRKAPDDDSLAYWDWICSECEAYWLLEGSNRGSCSR